MLIKNDSSASVFGKIAENDCKLESLNEFKFVNLSKTKDESTPPDMAMPISTSDLVLKETASWNKLLNSCNVLLKLKLLFVWLYK